jgi:ribosomal protein S18 acetylase RimI-like enzyme
VISERDGAVLRHAREDDLDAIDALTVAGYAPIQASFVSMLGADLYETVHAEPDRGWDERKCAQNRTLFAEHPEQVWVLDAGGDVVGYVTFWLFPDRRYGHLDNNAVADGWSGGGWATFMYRAVLDHFRALGLEYAHVDTGLDDAHIPARRAYEAVGFDRAVPSVDLWQRL